MSILCMRPPLGHPVFCDPCSVASVAQYLSDLTGGLVAFESFVEPSPGNPSGWSFVGEFIGDDDAILIDGAGEPFEAQLARELRRVARLYHSLARFAKEANAICLVEEVSV